MCLASLIKRAFVIAGMCIATTTAAAQESGERNHLLSVSAGWFDVLDNLGDQAVDFRLEFRPDFAFLIDTPMFELKPFIGVEAATNGALYGLGGILLDVSLGDRFIVTPSFGAGGYSNGGSPTLGHGIQFRSQIEAGYRFRNESRLTAAFSHISNAGLGNKNPGVEILSVYYHIPLRSLLGN